MALRKYRGGNIRCNV